MASSYEFTRHAKERSSTRNIPEMVAEIIVEYGESRDAGDGALKYVLTKKSMSELRRRAGASIVNAIAFYRDRNAYVVASGGRIVTVAYASSPLFH